MALPGSSWLLLVPFGSLWLLLLPFFAYQLVLAPLGSLGPRGILGVQRRAWRDIGSRPRGILGVQLAGIPGRGDLSFVIQIQKLKIEINKVKNENRNQHQKHGKHTYYVLNTDSF